MLKNTMIDYLPLYERKSKTLNELIYSEAAEIQLKYDAIEDFKLQLSVEAATWGLDYYESELGIPTDYSKPLEHRRSFLKSKMRINGKCDRMLIKLVCDAYTNGDVDVSFNGRIIIKFTSVRGLPPNLNDLKVVLEEIKPATKAIEFIFLYTLWSEVKKTTWGQVKASSWGELRTKVIT